VNIAKLRELVRAELSFLPNFGSLQCLEACCSFCHVDANHSYLERSRNGIHGLARHLMSQGPGRGAWQRRRQPCPGQTPTSELECALRSLLAHTCTTKCWGCNRHRHVPAAVEGRMPARSPSPIGGDLGPMSAFGTKRTSRHSQAMSAFGGKADIVWTRINVR